jgi:hypothetical protein
LFQACSDAGLRDIAGLATDARQDDLITHRSRHRIMTESRAEKAKSMLLGCAGRGVLTLGCER